MNNQPRTIRGESVPVYLEARAILTLLGPDPAADQRMLELGHAIGALCRLCDTHLRRHYRATRNQAATINRAHRRAA